jgi:predicted TIM-barrel fold metal-dependent hydrolase
MKTIRQCVAAGSPIEAPFIDAHGHFGPWPETVIPDALDYEKNIAEMDRFGCDMVWMSTSNPGYADDLSRKNDTVLAFAARYPERIIPYCTLSAFEPERNVAELKRCLASGPCIGVKMHRYRQPGYTMKSDFLQPVLELLQEHRLLYMNHAFPNIPDLEWACGRYPDVTFMEGHFAASYADLTLKVPNFVDCTCAALHYREVENQVRRTGRGDTLLVGSDFSLFSLAFGIGQIAYSAMSEDDQRAILGMNAIRIMERTSWFKLDMIAKLNGRQITTRR